MSFIVLAHGGASSDPHDRDGPEAAVRHGMDILRSGGSALDAAVAACVMLEDDVRFNAGTGSNLRFDGKTIEMDASVMRDDGRFGGVACIRDVKNPVLVARALLDTPHNMLAGEGATRYARALGYPEYNPWTSRAQGKFDRLREAVRTSKHDPADVEWDLIKLATHWNYELSFKELMGEHDTVGAIATDGHHYAAAASTGGTMGTLLGRVGDVPLPGCGIHAGPNGAVAVTGHGDFLARAMLASHLYRQLEAGTAPEVVVQDAYPLFPPHVDVGIILIHGNRHAGGCNRGMAWAALEEKP